MQDIERILTDADVKPTAIRMMVMKKIIAIGHTFTLSDMEIRLETAADLRYTADANAEAHIPLISILHAHPAERPSA